MRDGSDAGMTPNGWRASADRVMPAGVAVVVAANVVAFAFGSSSVPRLHEVGSWLRWVLLFVLLGVGFAYLLATRPRTLPAPSVYAFAGVFALLALASSLWSVEPRLTATRAVSLGVLMAAAGALGLVAAERKAAAAAVLVGIVLGAFGIAAAGLVLWVLEPAYAVQYTAFGTFDRLRGLGENPNAVPMIVGLALPAAAWVIAVGRRRAVSLAGAAAVAVLAVTIVVSESRGGLVAGVVGLVGLVLAWRRRPVVRFASMVTIVCAFVGGFVVSDRLTQELSAEAPRPDSQAGATAEQGKTGTAVEPGSKGVAEPGLVPFVPRDYEIGHPSRGGTDAAAARTPLRTSGRLDGWKLAAEQGNRRPLLGHGFGTEEKVFIDRSYVLLSGRPENSYLGLFLQLGIVGTGLFIGLGGVLAVLAVRTARRLRRIERLTAVTLGCVVLGGYTLAVVQSFVYSVGNIATVSFWLSVFMLAAASAWHRSASSSVPVSARISPREREVVR